MQTSMADLALRSRQGGYARLIKLIALNFDQNRLPETLWVTEATHYNDINLLLHQTQDLGAPNLSVLQQFFGPRPCWKIPVEGARLPSSINCLYIVDTNKQFSLALVRSPVQDVAILLAPPSLESISIEEIMKSTLSLERISASSITFLYENEDIRTLKYDYEHYQWLTHFPTVFFVLEQHSQNDYKVGSFYIFNDHYVTVDVKFRDSVSMPIPDILQMPYLRSERLVDLAPELPVLSLQCIHISLAFRHSIISLAESMALGGVTNNNAHICTRIQRLLEQAKDIFDDIQETYINAMFLVSTQNHLDRIFYGLCDEHPGAVSIRQSFAAYRNCAEIDFRYCDIQAQPVDLEAHLTSRWKSPFQLPQVELLQSDESSSDTESAQKEADSIQNVSIDKGKRLYIVEQPTEAEVVSLTRIDSGTAALLDRQYSSGPLATQHPLPEIRDDATRLMVFTHVGVEGRPKGLAEDEIPAKNNMRLALLGDSVINLIVTATLEEARPLSRPGDLANKRSLLVNQDRVAAWSDSYGLSRRLRVHAAQKLLIPNNVVAKVEVFQAYVGALFKQGGYDAVEEWFGPVVEQAIYEILTTNNEKFAANLDNVTLSDSPGAGRRSQSRPSRSQPFKRGTDAPVRLIDPDSALALFNQTCSQRFIVPVWTSARTGRDHNPVFTETITLPGELQPIGTGTGPSKKLAKREAAQMALVRLGMM